MLECRDLTVSFGTTLALDGVTLAVEAGTTMAIMGPSGSGKSTLLRTIAGLQRPDAGTVWWNGENITRVPPHLRKIGFMFQDYALFPHRTVAGNVAFGLRMGGVSPDDTNARVSAMLDLVGMGAFADRRIDDLSGGEQQRIALARTLAPQPDLILLDEPLGALDRTMRERLLGEMRGIFASLDVTVVAVTHDTDEAFGLADTIGVMEAGRLVQVDTPEALWNGPSNEAVASLIGHQNIVNASIVKALSLPADSPDASHVIAPNAIEIADTQPHNAVVVSSRFATGHHEVMVSFHGVTLLAESAQHWPAGTPVHISAKRSVTLDD